jgi:hypothetical protein
MVHMMTLWVMGDVHGWLERAQGVLARAGVVGTAGHWNGGDSTLAFLGDLVDRGPDGIGVIEWIMQLEAEAARAGGQVVAILGNHDVLLMSAARWPERFMASWHRNGGNDDDLARLSAEHRLWLERRPAMALSHDHLLMHADALLYEDYGWTIEAVNDSIQTVLQGDEPDAYERLLDVFSQREVFMEGADLARAFMDTYGGTRIVHGHTPIWRVTNRRPEDVTEPYVYADGLCVNVDQCFYRNGPGLLYSA